MTPSVTWTDLESSRASARRQALLRVGVPLGVAGAALGVALMPSAPDSTTPLIAGLGAMLLTTYAALSAKGARRAFERHHQMHVLPKVFEEAGVTLRCSPDTTPSWLVLHRSRLLPQAQQVRPGALLHGTVDGVFLEAGGLVLTTEKVIRKVRRVQRPVFTGAVYMADLGAGHAPGDLVVLARGARWPRTARKGARWMRLPATGLGWGTRVYAEVGSAVRLPEAAVAHVAQTVRLHRGAALSIQDGRHLVVVVPGRSSLFRPSSVFAPLARDKRAAKSLGVMRVVAGLAMALGAKPESVQAQSEVALVVARDVPQAPALVEAPVVRPGVGWKERVARCKQAWDKAKVHPVIVRAGAVVVDAGKTMRGSSQATAAQERTMEAWDGLRARLGVATGPQPQPRVVNLTKVTPVGENKGEESPLS